MTQEAQKLKLLYLLKIFHEKTDSEHSLTMPQIIEELGASGIQAERKALYRDFERLREFGYEIEKRHTSPTSYAMANRKFSESELMLLADAVQSCRFLSKPKSDALLRSIKSLGSQYQVKDLSKRLHVEGRVRSQNESVFGNLDTIQAAIHAKRKLEFKYFKHDAAKKRQLQHGGDTYIETPVQLVFSDSNYYVIVYNDKHDGFASYRVDRMERLRISDERATRNEKIAAFDVTDYEARAFGMFSGEAVLATITINEGVMSAFIDRFGPDLAVSSAKEPGTAKVSVHVMKAPTFYGWLAQFGTQAHIDKPTSLAEDYKAYLQEIAENY